MAISLENDTALRPLSPRNPAIELSIACSAAQSNFFIAQVARLTWLTNTESGVFTLRPAAMFSKLSLSYDHELNGKAKIKCVCVWLLY